MTIKFDITGTPPTAEDIDRDRAQLKVSLISINRIGWLMIIALALLDAGLWWAWWQGAMVNVGLLVIALVVAGVAAGCWWVEAKDSLRERIGQLHPAPKEACLNIATWIKQDTTVNAYCTSVVSERQITHGEYLAMKEWVEGTVARQTTEDKQRQIEQACRDVYGARQGEY